MLDRLWIAVIALIISLGLAGEAGAIGTWAFQDATPCQSRLDIPSTSGHSVPMPECNTGTEHMACTAHATCVFALAPASSALRAIEGPAGWDMAAPSPLVGGRLPPDTPPPIALI